MRSWVKALDYMLIMMTKLLRLWLEISKNNDNNQSKFKSKRGKSKSK